MRLGRASAYAVLALAHLAEHENGVPIQGRDIASACAVPPGHLLKILQQLVRAQLLNSERGPSGGFALRKPASEITLLDVIEAIDGPICGDVLMRGAGSGKGLALARLEQACREVAEYTRTRLAQTAIAELVPTLRA